MKYCRSISEVSRFAVWAVLLLWCAWGTASTAAPQKKKPAVPKTEGRIFLNEKTVSFSGSGGATLSWHRIATTQTGKTGNDVLGTISVRWIPGVDTVSFEKVAIVKKADEKWIVQKDMTAQYRSMLEKDFAKEKGLGGEVQRTYFLPKAPGAIAEVMVKRTRDFGQFEGNVWDSHNLSQTVPVDRAVYEVTVPKDTVLAHEQSGAGKPEIKDIAENRSYRWEAKNIKARKESDPHPVYVTVSTTPEWGYIAGWFRDIYDRAAQPTPEIRKKAYSFIDTISSKSYLATVLADQVRTILSNEVVAGDMMFFRPRPAGEVYKSGAGDCKDKAVVLLAMFKLARIEAFPAFLSASEDIALDRHLPNPFYFDHAIVYVPAQEGIASHLWFDLARSEPITGSNAGAELFGHSSLVVTRDGWKIIKVEDSPH